MVRFIKTFILFTAFVAMFYTTMLYIWSSYAPSRLKKNVHYSMGSYGHTFTRLKDVKNVKNVDILFLGSSHTYRGFDPRVFSANGYSTFNLGSSAQSPTQTKVLLSRYLNQLNPKLIIYEVYPPTLSIDGVESSLDIIANDINDLNSLRMALELNHMKTYNTLIYCAIRDLFSFSKSYNEPLNKGQDTYVSGGYVEKQIAHFIPISYQKQNLDLNQQEAFRHLIKKIKKRGIELILVFAPVSPSLYSSYLNTSEFDKLMAQYSTYYNFNENLSLNDSTHFYNSDHLNQLGVERFNKKLIRLLKKRACMNKQN